MVLKIGPLAVDPPVVLAPMAGVTNAAFRRLCRSYGAGLYVSEMVSARALLQGNETTGRLAAFGADEDVRSVQLYGVDPGVVAAAVLHVVEDVGVHHVDLNMGCPSPKVTRRGGGAALPVHTLLFARIVRAAVRAAGAVPVTVKLRMGVNDATPTYLDAGRAAQDEGAAAVALHARTAEQLYSGRADWTAIARLKQELTAVPVLGNGDVWTAPDALRMQAETGCDGVVVGRGCLGRPWLFRDLADAFAGRPVLPAPPLGEVLQVMRRHARLLVEAKGDEAYGVRLPQARRLVPHRLPGRQHPQARAGADVVPRRAGRAVRRAGPGHDPAGGRRGDATGPPAGAAPGGPARGLAHRSRRPHAAGRCGRLDLRRLSAY